MSSDSAEEEPAPPPSIGAVVTGGDTSALLDGLSDSDEDDVEGYVTEIAAGAEEYSTAVYRVYEFCATA